MKHFPAPWRIEGSFDDDVAIEIRAADDTLVCEIEPFTDKWTEEEITNVRLIAAAPELLRFSGAASHALKSYQHGNSSTELAEEVAAALDTVIARVEAKS